MSIDQIEYIDHLLPYFGCDGVNDTTSLFNKHTITNEPSLRDKINNDLPRIRAIFPTKSLNLVRLDNPISSQQMYALLRGLMKISQIDYVVVRRGNAEYMRLNYEKNNLTYYIIQKQMNTLTIQPIPSDRNIPNEYHKLTKRFLVKVPEGINPNGMKFMLIIAHQEVARTKTFVYDEKLKMWEPVLFKECFSLCETLPKCLAQGLPFGLLTHQNLRIYTNIPDSQVFMEQFENIDFTPFIRHNQEYRMYVRFMDFYSTKTNILSFSQGMFGCQYSFTLRKYCSCDEQTIDVVHNVMGDTEVEHFRNLWGCLQPI